MESQKFGNVQKCPNCGAVVEAGTAKCNYCGYVFRNIEANSSTIRLAEKIDAIEAKHCSKKSIISDMNPNTELRRQKEVASAIKNFPMPSSKDDLLEFAISMQAKWTNTDRYESLIKKAYKAKYDEAINKAKVLFPNDPQFSGLFEQAKKSKKGCFGSIFLVLLPFLSFVIVLCM
ncbi:MAG: hypothetical protein IKW83_11015 [Muribaculaceae bacterium]|nr:hypothetical protein [Muribaculaceae bacterium]